MVSPELIVFWFLKWEYFVDIYYSEVCKPVSVLPCIKNVKFFLPTKQTCALAVDNAKIKRKQAKAVMAGYCS
jgi:hypothetical protein